VTKAQKLEKILLKAKAGKRLTPAEEREVERARWAPSLADVARHFGLVRQSLDSWKPYDTENALAKTERGYDLEALQRLRDRMHAEGKNPRLLPGDKTGGASSDEDSDPTALKARKLRLECDKLATQIEILRGKYALIDDIMAQLLPIIYSFKEKLIRLGPELAFEVSGVSPADAEDRIRMAAEKILTELAEDDIPRLEEALRKPSDSFGDQDGRMPAAREANGRQKA
jgi:hypothetical protein